MRILYIHSTLVPPPLDPRTDRFVLLSDSLEGDVLQPTWFRSAEQVEAAFGPGSYPVYTAGRFRYHWFLAYRYHGLRRRLVDLVSISARDCNSTAKPVRLHRRIFPHDDGACCRYCQTAHRRQVDRRGGDVSRFGVSRRATPADFTRSSHETVLRRVLASSSLWFSDRAHLLYPAQLDNYPLLRRFVDRSFTSLFP